MINEYYGFASTPTEDYLTHYGVRGMKWGVRKALHKKSDKALSRQYRKAQKKLEKYKEKMNLTKQENEDAYHTGKTIRTGIGALGSLGAGYGIRKAIVDNPVLQNSVRANAMVPSLAATLLGAGLAAKEVYHATKAIAARRRTGKEGHKKAVVKYTEKANKWKHEMDKSFSGTKYAGKYTPLPITNKSKRRKSK